MACTQVDVLSAGVRHRGAQLGERQSAGESDEAPDQPGQHQERRRRDALRHDASGEEDAGADDDSDHHHHRVEFCQAPLEIGLGVHSAGWV
jgi:hypothetical protein